MRSLRRQVCGRQTMERKKNYEEYEFGRGEKTVCFGICLAVVLFLSVFFYRSLWAAVFLSPIGYFLYRQMKRKKTEKQLTELGSQFKECILCTAANLRAGYSAENAFCQSDTDMALLFGDNCLIAKELLWMKKGLQNNINLEELLKDFGERSGLEDIREFAEVFAIVKRNGGDLPAVISDTAVLLSERLEMQKEIRVLISGRQFEQKIMSVIPFGIVLYVEITTPGYFDVLYRNVSGILVMSLCLGVYIAAYVMAHRIIDTSCRRSD